MADNEHKTLNSVIKTLIDSIKGYESAAEVASDPNVKARLESNARVRRDIVSRLQRRVTELGEEPEKDGSALGAAHRTFLDLRSKVTGNTDAAVNEVENGETYLREKIEKALSEVSTEESRSLLREALMSASAGQGEAQRLDQAS